MSWLITVTPITFVVRNYVSDAKDPIFICFSILAFRSKPSKDSDVERLSYPLFTKVDSNGIESIPVVSNRPRNIDVSWLSSEKQCIEYIIEKASSGKSVVWIRNTIDDALRAFRSLLSSEKIDPGKILLFHSRFAFSDRQRIEEQAVSELGKHSSSERAGGKSSSRLRSSNSHWI